VITPSAESGTIGSGFGFIVLISCFSFAKSFCTFRPQSESSALRLAASHCKSSTFALPFAIAVRRLATSDPT
jgi:hypothetical protein